MTAEKTSYAILTIDIPDGSENAEPATRVFCEVRVGSLKEDLYPIKRPDNRFSLESVSVMADPISLSGRGPYSASCETPSQATSQNIVQAPFVELVLLAYYIFHCYRNPINREAF